MSETVTPATDAAWDPKQYQLFGDHRGRPFRDLVARIPKEAPRLVVDLGCGPGDLTLTLAARWPEARVIGIDNSPEMLEQARATDADGRVEWLELAAEDWDPTAYDAPVDVLVTNATLQWVPTHLRLIPDWVRALAPGGVFAMQVPSNFSAPSHRLMREVAFRQPRAEELRSTLDRADAVAMPETYAALLLDVTPVVDVWETTYQQVMPVGPEGSHPVLEWVKGTGLRPVLGVLTGEAEREAFLAEYEKKLETAYPRRHFGVLFAFSRIFAIAHKA